LPSLKKAIFLRFLNTIKVKKVVKYVNLMGQEVGPEVKGVVFEVYEDGTSKKIIR
jgi:hypothetical protein